MAITRVVISEIFGRKVFQFMFLLGNFVLITMLQCFYENIHTQKEKKKNSIQCEKHGDMTANSGDQKERGTCIIKGNI